MDEKKVHCSNHEQADDKKKSFKAPLLTKYGTVKDVVKGPSCKAVMSYSADK